MRFSDKDIQDYLNTDGAYSDDSVLMETVQEIALDLLDARDAVAAALIFDDEEYDDIEWAATAWQRLKRSLETDPMWSEGRHRGDCTREAFSCNRCLVERYERLADRLLQVMDKQ